MHVFIAALHVLGSGVVMASVILAVVAGLSRTTGKESLALYKHAGTIGLYGLFWQLITGLHLLSEEVEALSKNPVFWIKMALFALASLIAYGVIMKKVLAAERGAHRDAKIPGMPFWLFVLLAIITAVVVLGVVLEHR